VATILADTNILGGLVNNDLKPEQQAAVGQMMQLIEDSRATVALSIDTHRAALP
jgi:hypothetical protein